MKWLFGKKSNRSPRSPYIDMDQDKAKYKKSIKKYLTANRQLLVSHSKNANGVNGVKHVTRKRKSHLFYPN